MARYVNLRNKKWIVVQAGTVKPLHAYMVHKTATNKASAIGNAEVMSADYYADKCAEKIDVRNCISGKLVQIRRDQEGTCCDPSMERYHCM